jgi:hypothetical protein
VQQPQKRGFLLLRRRARLRRARGELCSLSAPSNITDFEAAQKRLRVDAEARAEAERQAAVERAKRRIAAEQGGADEAA